MSRWGRLLERACAQRGQIPIILAVLAVVGVLLAITFPLLEPGTGTFVVALMDLVLVVSGFVGFALLYRYCTKRAMDETDVSYADGENETDDADGE